MAQHQQGANKQNALKDYVEVNVRIEKFYEKYPNGRILTELVSWKDEVVVMKATVYRDQSDQHPSSTGHAYEKEGSSFINKTSALENCETSAVGRALAILGFEIKKSVASKEEVENAKLNQNTANVASEKTLFLVNKLIKEVAQVMNITEAAAVGTLKQRMKSAKDINQYTQTEASKAIEILNKAKEVVA
jgi:hypothetical protein